MHMTTPHIIYSEIYMAISLGLVKGLLLKREVLVLATMATAKLKEQAEPQPLETYKQSSGLSAQRLSTFPSRQIICSKQSLGLPSGGCNPGQNKRQREML